MGIAGYLVGMGANTRSKILPWLAAMAAIVLVAVLLGVLLRQGDASREARGPEVEAEAPARPAATAGLAPGEPPARPQALAPPLTAGDAPSDPHSASPSSDEPRAHPVDLAKLRERLPDNLYWELGVPTKDPSVLQKRTEEERRWNELYGKVQSNTATEQEIRQYYEHRRAVSEDFIEFASLVLQEYGPQLPEQERGLYELSIRMHRTRLEEIPRQTEEALARKRDQEQRRENWRGDGRGN
jgi:hypothetical protein